MSDLNDELERLQRENEEVAGGGVMKILLLIVSPIVAPIALLCVGFKVWVDFFSAKLLESIQK